MADRVYCDECTKYRADLPPARVWDGYEFLKFSRCCEPTPGPIVFTHANHEGCDQFVPKKEKSDKKILTNVSQ